MGKHRSGHKQEKSLKIKKIPNEILKIWYENKLEEVKNKQEKFLTATLIYETFKNTEGKSRKEVVEFIEEEQRKMEHPNADEAYSDFREELEIASMLNGILKKREEKIFFRRNLIVPIVSIIFSAIVAILSLYAR